MRETSLPKDPAIEDSVAERARESRGTSGLVLYELVAQVLRMSGRYGHLYDVGCGAGMLRPFVAEFSRSYTGVDAVRYPEFPNDATFVATDLDSPRWPVPNDASDITVAVETIEHLENPRAFFRELTRITRGGGLIIVTTPNQTSWLSKLTLILKDEFNAFQARPGLYPAHRTALLEIDLRRIAEECRLTDIRTYFSGCGRIPGTRYHWPKLLSRSRRAFSDNVLLLACKQ